MVTASVACGDEQIDPRVLAGSDNDCVLACATDDDCCPGYVCSQEGCSPHLGDGRCWNDSFETSCDPRFDGECAEGATCTSTDGVNVRCVPQDSLGVEGDECGYDGDGCGPGLWCTVQGCKRACCSDAECGYDELCSLNAGQLGSFGACF